MKLSEVTAQICKGIMIKNRTVRKPQKLQISNSFCSYYDHAAGAILFSKIGLSN